ncbi:molybdate ABC transporter permease [Pacificimonas flava]|uniref:Molybdenum transport system permease n=2 Tax=Pacificimonas TaxID=1960290 RepID=A0A219B5I7_9SPHN|nr:MULTISPECIES: molybdate ABC transporter permease subunit [Pacificimonas]MBZ6379158.1 molybdate ABC transporter permease subunit [Pacificimonas aurantium]OWV33617.1 molybdate ABC transporter permease [Pacificimonas flava]
MTATEWAIVVLSLKVGGIAVLFTLPLAFGLAWLLARSSFPGKVVLDGFVHLPLVLPPVVTGWLLLLLFAPEGPVGMLVDDLFGASVLFRWSGAAIAAGVMALPLMVRAIRLSLEAVDKRLEEAARTLGAGRTRTFVRITLPLALPGILAGMMLGFARALGEFGATITFVSNIPGETRTLPLAIYTQLQTPGGEAAVIRLAAISVGIALLALVASEVLARRSGRGVHVL